jgi:hypothetical protein
MENPKCKACGEDYIEVVCDGVTQYNHNCKENYKCIYCGAEYKMEVAMPEFGTEEIVSYCKTCDCLEFIDSAKQFQKMNQVIDEELSFLNKQIEYHQKNKQSKHKEKYKKRFNSKYYGRNKRK